MPRRTVPIRPVPGVWLVSGMMSSYAKASAEQIARAAMEAATRRPELVFRNQEKVEQGWKQMREDRAGSMEFFGGDELVLPPAEATERLNAYYRRRQEAALARRPARRRHRNLPGLDVPAFELPSGLAEAPPEGLVLPARAPAGRLGDRRPPARARLRRPPVTARTQPPCEIMTGHGVVRR